MSKFITLLLILLLTGCTHRVNLYIHEVDGIETIDLKNVEHVWWWQND